MNGRRDFPSAIFLKLLSCLMFCFCFSVNLRKNRNKMNYQEFRNKLFELGCFNSNQAYAWKPDFDKNNLGRWVKQGWLVKLRNSY